MRDKSALRKKGRHQKMVAAFSFWPGAILAGCGFSSFVAYGT